MSLSYQALYRVWRPQQFLDVVGQEHVTTTLQNALMQQQISHAYLFSGPRGTGKTSAAKIFAKTVNCEQSPVSEPCNECATCRGITDGSITDVIEIDAASNNGVDEIRDIRDKVKYAPSTAKYKVYIIDEVHMLTTGAYNALLKTLEEPPAHVIFILATTEPHKIPLTVISRCQRFDFKRITAKTIVERMKAIVERTGITFEENALTVIARAAEGGMRDALSLLDQAISFSNNDVTVEDALTVTGTVSQTILNTLARSLNNQDVATALESLEELLFLGKDPARFVEDFIFFYRDMLLYKTAPSLAESLERVTLDDDFKQIAEATSANELYYFIEVLNKTQQEMRWTNHPRIFLEVALVKLCHHEQQESSTNHFEVEKLFQRIEQLEKELVNLKSVGSPPKQAEPAPQQSRQRSFQKGYQAPIGKINQILKQATKQDLNIVKSNWAKMLQELANKQMRADVALLHDAEPVASSSEAFVIQFKHDIHCQMAMEKTQFLENISLFLQREIGSKLEVVGAPATQWKKIREDFIQNQQQNNDEESGQVEEEPLIAEAKKLFGEDLIEIKE